MVELEDITGQDTVTVEDITGDEAFADEEPFVPSATFSGARAGYTFKAGAEGTGYYRDEGKATVVPPAPAASKPTATLPPPPETAPPAAPERDGVPLTEDLIRRKAEHNEGMLSTLEEIALHQLDIDRIEVLNNCRCLQIVYLQSNLLKKIENLHRLKKLDYLNVALNNISKIENLERCESLRKLDMTVNFVDLDELHSVGSLKNNTLLRELFLTGNPCTQHWEEGYRDYVIATLPQLTHLDGVEIQKSERIRAMQRLPQLEKELPPLAKAARVRKEEQVRRRIAKKQAIAAGLIEDDDTDEWCPEVRIKDSRELREIEEKKEETRRKAQKEDPLFPDQTPRQRRFFKDDGTPTQMNTAKWPFAVDEDGEKVTVDVALPKFLDSAQIDADVQPTYVRISAKKNVLQLVLPAEVLTTASTAHRSSTTGHLLLTCPKVCPVVVSKAPEPKRKPKQALQSSAAPAGSLLGPKKGAKGENLKGAVDIRGIVASSPNAPEGGGPKKAVESLGADWSDEEDVPPLA